jgi:uncharacterized repeat protein (TIGR03803 family)
MKGLTKSSLTLSLLDELRKIVTVSAIAIAVALASQSGEAQTLKTILSFNGQSDGAYPSSGLTADAKGNGYGTTQAGGVFNFNGGTVYRLNRNGHETVLYSFCVQTNCVDGATPYGGVILDSSGNLFGTTSGGGAFGFGVVFKLDSSGNETVLYSFKGLAEGDGASPAYGNLVRDAAGNLYGATLNGGQACSYSMAGCGVIYRISPAGQEKIVHVFTGGSDGGLPPWNPMVSGGALYGTTFNGGSAGCGVVFKIAGNGQLTVPHNFGCSEGDASGPNAGLIRDSAGTLYGTTAFGGIQSQGTVYQLVPSTGIETVLHMFTGGTSDGCVPGLANLTLDASGNLYGTAPSCGASGTGVIFELDAARNETVLYNFMDGTDGGVPQSTLLRDAAGNLYGTTYFVNGFSCCGTVFKFTP